MGFLLTPSLAFLFNHSPNIQETIHSHSIHIWPDIPLMESGKARVLTKVFWAWILGLPACPALPCFTQTDLPTPGLWPSLQTQLEGGCSPSIPTLNRMHTAA